MSNWSEEEQKLRHIPDYIVEYAPYCHLFSKEEYWPGLMDEHLEHTTPFINYDPVSDEWRNPTLDSLDRLNHLGNMYLQSDDDPETYPHWIGGLDNIPPEMGIRRQQRSNKTMRAAMSHRSPAPAMLIVVDKGEYVDAFWFFFYSFNLGNQVLGVRFGNHVGDWEHTAIRFKNGKPILVFYSEHEWGAAYTWENAEKMAGTKRVSRLMTERVTLTMLDAHLLCVRNTCNVSNTRCAPIRLALRPPPRYN